jgi:hypothetical protein
MAEADLIIRFYLDEISESGQYNLLLYYNKVIKRYNEGELMNVFYFLVGNYPHIVLTDLISERLIRQQSVFAIVPNKFTNVKFNEYRKENYNGLWIYIKDKGLKLIAEDTKIGTAISNFKSKIIKYHQSNKWYIIEAKVKKHILKQLDSICINEARIFPELYYEGKNIIDK